MSTNFSESPTDVVSFAASLARGLGHGGVPVEQKSRKRSSVNAGGVTVKGEAQVTGETAKGDAHAENERKKLRTLSSDEATFATAIAAAATSLTRRTEAVAEQHAAQAKQEEAEKAFENEMDGLDALSLLSHCAVQLQVSQPSTPLFGPSKHAREKSWGETSILNALPSMSLSAPGSTGQGSFIPLLAAAAAQAAVTD